MIWELVLNLLCLLLTLKMTHFIVMFLKKEIEAHNMLSLMFNLKFKSLCLVFSFVGYTQGILII
jgi:hypothetical protein